MVQAEPNKTQIKFEVLKKLENPDFSEKTELEIKILPSEGEVVERFIKSGQIYRGFTFEQEEELEVGKIYLGEGEYIGGPDRGMVQLTKIRSEDCSKPDE